MVVSNKLQILSVRSLSCLSALLIGLPLQLQAATDTNVDADSTSLMPPARSGECYGKVRVPAQYKIENIDVVVKEGTSSFAITGPKFKDTTKKVLVKDGYTKLTALQPVAEDVNDVFVVSPASSRWVRGAIDGSLPVSEGDKLDVTAAGLDLTTVKTGSCVYEHYKPAVVVDVPEKVLISQASEKIEVQNATFRKGTENVLIKSAYNRLVEVPAVFKEVDDKVLVEPATSIWKKGTGPIQRINNLTGEIMCRVDVPAVFKNVKKSVVETAPLVTTVAQPADYKTINVEKLVTDAKEVRTPVAAKYRTINKKRTESEGSYAWLESKSTSAATGKPTGRVLCNQAIAAKEVKYKRTAVTTPGRVNKESVEPKYRAVSVVELVQDSASSNLAVAAKTTQFEKRTKISDARFEWQPVLCETNMTNDVVARVQQALKDNGYAVGTIDGILGKGTYRAIERYQGDKNLSRGGITMETVKALGVSL